jgi:hypothetical protein
MLQRTLMNKLSVGADIEAQCSKCGESWHVILAKVGENIAKVQCKRCGGQHRYKGVAGATTTAATRSRSPGTTSSGAGRSTTTATRVRTRGRAAAVPTGPSVMADTSRPVRPYRMTDLYSARDRIMHPRFGIGVVEGSSGPGKITVYFTDGRRTLAMAEAPSRLSACAAEALVVHNDEG